MIIIYCIEIIKEYYLCIKIIQAETLFKTQL